MSKLNVDQKTIKELFQDKKADFLIPDYQRPYAWGEAECQTLWDDIFSFAIPDEGRIEFDSNSEYFLGPIVTFRNLNSKLEVIDGQQRLTTLMLLLRAFYTKFGHILFILTCDGKAQAWIGYKEAAASGSNAFKVGRYYHTDWMPEDELHLSIDGLNMDAVYESLVRQIAGDKLQADSGESLKESVERDEKKKQLEKQIAALENKMRKEKQLNRRMEMNAELKILRKEFETYG